MAPASEAVGMVTQAAERHTENIRKIGLVVPAGAPTRDGLGCIFARKGTLPAPYIGFSLTERLHPQSARGPL